MILSSTVLHRGLLPSPPLPRAPLAPETVPRCCRPLDQPRTRAAAHRSINRVTVDKSAAPKHGHAGTADQTAAPTVGRNTSEWQFIPSPGTVAALAVLIGSACCDGAHALEHGVPTVRTLSSAGSAAHAAGQGIAPPQLFPSNSRHIPCIPLAHVCFLRPKCVQSNTYHIIVILASQPISMQSAVVATDTLTF